MTDRPQLATGLACMIAAAVCCLAPLLLVATGLLGTSLFVAISIYLLSPIVAVFIAAVAYCLWRERAETISSKR